MDSNENRDATRRPVRRALWLLGALCLSASAAWAGDFGLRSAPETTWACWYHERAEVACVIVAAGDQGRSDAANVPLLNVEAVAPRRLLAAIREQPHLLRGRYVFIPLHTDVSEPEHVAELAQAVMCGSRHACTARVNAQSDPGGNMTAEELVDASDPVLWHES